MPFSCPYLPAKKKKIDCKSLILITTVECSSIEIEFSFNLVTNYARPSATTTTTTTNNTVTVTTTTATAAATATTTKTRKTRKREHRSNVFKRCWKICSIHTHTQIYIHIIYVCSMLSAKVRKGMS